MAHLSYWFNGNDLEAWCDGSGWVLGWVTVCGCTVKCWEVDNG